MADTSIFARRLYRAALKGDKQAANLIKRFTLFYLSDAKCPPPGMSKLCARLDGVKCADGRHRGKIKLKRKRPSLDEKQALRRAYLTRLSRKKFFGESPSEKIALMVAYLYTVGYTLTKVDSRSKQSAFLEVAELSKVSVGSVENYYKKHKNKINQIDESAIKLGEALVLRCKSLNSLPRRGRRL